MTSSSTTGGRAETVKPKVLCSTRGTAHTSMNRGWVKTLMAVNAIIKRGRQTTKRILHIRRMRRTTKSQITV
eukprot:14841415-Heterocapsa_arctica.AAC.1